MPYHKLKKAHPEYDPHYIQEKIGLVIKGLPIDISEKELGVLETMLRGARSFYIDLLLILEGKKMSGEDVKEQYVAEAINLADIEIALRKVDEFRNTHWSKISHS